ncbi:MAG TPA: glutaminyl-peptide cyclotransferase [Polyangia bacterium]
MKRATTVVLAALLAGACANKSAPHAPATNQPRTVQDLTAMVINRFPHDRGAFTQGLVYAQGKLYESTGMVGRSSLRRVDLTTGTVELSKPVEEPIFAEGLALAGDELIQISWQNGRALVWRLGTFERLREHSYTGEGWGLTFDGTRLIMSDGSARLTFRDPRSFAATGGVDVTRGGRPVPNLNELEWADGHLYANVWMTETIVRIDAASGEVTATIDASGLLSPEERQGTDVLNGIAYVPERGTFFLTGKYWPRLFEVKFVPRS